VDCLTSFSDPKGDIVVVQTHEVKIRPDAVPSILGSRASQLGAVCAEGFRSILCI
jgi:hypothetical protein